MNLYELHAACGCNILAVDYRGFGKSEGNPCEEGKLSFQPIESKKYSRDVPNNLMERWKFKSFIMGNPWILAKELCMNLRILLH